MKRRIFRISIITALIVSIAGCESFLDVNQNPNNPETANIDLLFPGAIAGAGFWTARSANENAGIFVRQFYNLNESTYNIQGNQTDTEFNQIYADPLKDFTQVIREAEERGLEGYAGISKVMTSYLFSVLTDLWGDVPYSEALQGETTLNAKFDDDQAIYNGLLTDLDEAIADLNKAAEDEESVSGDLIYNGNYENWIKAANTLKMKLLLNMRLVDPARAKTEIDALVAGGMLINSNDDDFQFQFGTSVTPINHHPVYQQEYIAGNKAFYMSNYLMYTMLAKEDPRLRYYIYRQASNSDLDFQTEPCSQRTDCIYWPLLDELAQQSPEADGYIGREHGDPSGLPADNDLRATWGVYPIGGSYDNGAKGERNINSGTGAGIMPWITNSMRAFMQAEAALTLGTAGDPKTLLLEGVQASMDKVTEYGADQDDDAPAPNDPDLVASIESYIASIGDAYDDAANDAQRLDVIIKEKYFAEFGNGVEAYNDYRRTGFPSDLPASLAPGGPFPLRFPLGPTELTSNPNAPNPAPLVSEPIFWDVN